MSDGDRRAMRHVNPQWFGPLGDYTLDALWRSVYWATFVTFNAYFIIPRRERKCDFDPSILVAVYDYWKCIA
jgi:hypothetical protein